MNIIKITDHHVIDFAAEELRKYLLMMLPEQEILLPGRFWRQQLRWKPFPIRLFQNWQSALRLLQRHLRSKLWHLRA